MSRVDTRTCHTHTVLTATPTTMMTVEVQPGIRLSVGSPKDQYFIGSLFNGILNEFLRGTDDDRRTFAVNLSEPSKFRMFQLDVALDKSHDMSAKAIIHRSSQIEKFNMELWQNSRRNSFNGHTQSDPLRMTYIMDMRKVLGRILAPT